jgi:hypothetical protein
MEESAAPATLWLFAVVGGPVLLGAIFGWGLWRAQGRANRGGDSGPSALMIQLGLLAAGTIMAIVIVGWWVGFFS